MCHSVTHVMVVTFVKFVSLVTSIIVMCHSLIMTAEGTVEASTCYTYSQVKMSNCNPCQSLNSFEL
jgi:hypothetical protein